MNNLDKIYKKIGNLEGITSTGFAAINKRLDITNGTIKSHEKRINDVEHSVDIMTGKATMIGIILGVLGTVIIELFNLFKK